ncbi:MAG: P-loop containing nucleoside triphosphate hydrolase protein [Monoraphidium minutum]|nr:MAG: P-loop containing nucleoside triphosphate hydrolase protein [Monoraphidium minutum]
MSPTTYLASLSEEQRAAALCAKQHVRVIAGPGSGKTRVVAARVAHLLRCGVPPRAVLAIAFTNKAAGELKGRLLGLLGPGRGAAGLQVVTFHALCAAVLGQHRGRLPPAYQKELLIYDGGDDAAGALLQGLAADAVGRWGRVGKREAKAMHSDISAMKNHVAAAYGRRGHDVMRELLAAGVRRFAVMQPSERDTLATCYDLYNAQLAREGAFDFDDLLGATVDLLARDQEVLSQLRARWQHILVDESQDTNGAQFELVRLLVGPATNLFAVGDPNQGIYGFRGSDPRHLTGAAGAFPGLETVYLRDNYRSQPPIITAGEAVLTSGGAPALYKGANPVRAAAAAAAAAPSSAAPWLELGAGGGRARPRHAPLHHVHVWSAPHQFSESDLVAEIVKASLEHVTSADEVAVLYRYHALVEPIERALRLAGVQYVKHARQAFWDAKEVAAALALARLAAAPQDTAALRRVLAAGLPIAKGIGAASLKGLEEWCEAQRGAAGGGGGDGGAAGPALAEALLGDAWGSPLERPAPPPAAAALVAAALALPSHERAAGAARAARDGGGGGAAAAAAAAAGREQDEARLEAFWTDVLSSDDLLAPARAGGALPPAVAKGKQAKVARRLRGLVALGRAAAAVSPPAVVIEVLLKASGFYLFVEAWEAKAAAAKATRGGGRRGGGGDSDDDEEGGGGDARGADGRRLLRRLRNVGELQALAGKPSLYMAAPLGLDEPEGGGDADLAGFFMGNDLGLDDLEDDLDGGGGGGGGDESAPVGLEALQRFCAYSKLVSGEEGGDVRPKVQLMTLHSSKGKEFETTLIVGNPPDRADDGPVEKLQSKNLIYTGVTRAKDTLHLVYARGRLEYDKFAQRWVESPEEAPINEHVALLARLAAAGKLPGAAMHVLGERDRHTIDEFVRDALAGAPPAAAAAPRGARSAGSGAAAGGALRGARRGAVRQGAARGGGGAGGGGQLPLPGVTE